MKLKVVFLVMIFILIVAFSNVFAEVPNMINYQGKITTPGGALIDTIVDMTFKIYGSESGNDSLWWETQFSVAVENGVFSVLLGSVSSIPNSVFDGSVRYLGVKVGNDSEMSPRKTIASVGYAFHSATAETAYYSMPDADWTIVRDTIYHLNGNVGIGTTSPEAKLEVAKDIAYGGTAIRVTNTNPDNNNGLAFETIQDGQRRVLIFPDRMYLNDVDGTESIVFNSYAPTCCAYFKRNVGIGTTNPQEKLDVEGNVQAYAFNVGDIFFQKDKEKLWRMFEDEDGLYLENLKTGKVYRFVLQEMEKE